MIKAKSLAALRPAADPNPYLTLLLAIVHRAKLDAENPHCPEIKADAELWLSQIREQLQAWQERRGEK